MRLVTALTPHVARARRLAGSMSWATFDQVLFALSNLVVTVAVARGGGVETLGRFSLAFAFYIAALGFCRSLISEPLLARPASADRHVLERASTTLTLLFAAAAAVVVGAVGVGLGRPELLVVAVALPVTLFQDVLRYQAFRRQRARLAALLDGGWLLGSVLAWPLVTRTASAETALLCWAGGAALGVVLAWYALRPRLSSPRVALVWWRGEARPLAGPLLVDSLLATVGVQALVFVVAFFEGDGALGLLRAGQVLFGPLGMIFTALGILAVPRLAQRAHATTSAIAVQLSLLLSGLAVVGCGAILVAGPLLHGLLFSDAIIVPTALLVPLALQVIVAAAGGGFTVVAKVRRVGVDIVRSRATSTVLGVIALVAGTALFGVVGAAWALVVLALGYTVDLGLRISRRGTTVAGSAPDAGSQDGSMAREGAS